MVLSRMVTAFELSVHLRALSPLHAVHHHANPITGIADREDLPSLSLLSLSSSVLPRFYDGFHAYLCCRSRKKREQQCDHRNHGNKSTEFRTPVGGWS